MPTVKITQECKIAFDGINIATFEKGEAEVTEAQAKQLCDAGHAEPAKPTKKPDNPAEGNKAADPVTNNKGEGDGDAAAAEKAAKKEAAAKEKAEKKAAKAAAKKEAKEGK